MAYAQKQKSARRTHKGPKGEKRPADIIGAAATVAKIATAEIEEDTESDDGVNKTEGELCRKGGVARHTQRN